MSLKTIIDQQIANAFNNILKPGELTEDVTFRYYVSAGTYDVEEDTQSPDYNDVEDVTVIVAKPGLDDMKDHGAIRSDAKLIVPGTFVPSEPEVDTDKVVRANGETWDIRKCVGVPGQGVYLVFIYRT